MKLLTINPKLTLTTMLIILFLSSITAASTFSESVKRNNAGNSNIETQATPNVLILYSENIQFVTQIENNFTSFGFTTSTLDMQSYTPTMAELNPYDVIFTWTDFSISDPIGVGNMLADYVDAGGSLIMSTGLFSPGFNVTGRFQSDGYYPFTQSNPFLSTRTYNGLSPHPIFNGVSTLTSMVTANVTLTPGTGLIASFTDGTPIAAIKGRVIAINPFPAVSWSGDLPKIWENSVNFLFTSPNILILEAEGDAFINEVIGNFSLSGFLTSTIDMQTYTPTLTELTPYEVIFAWSDFSILDPVAVGNVLADYIDAGGSLIMSSGLFSPSFNVTGRFQSDGYYPFTQSSPFMSPRTYDGLSPHPIFSGVSSLTSDITANVTITSGTTLVASFTDGTPIAAIKGRVIGLNPFPPTFWAGDLALVWKNSINMLLVNDDLAPTTSTPPDILYQPGSTGNVLMWTLNDATPMNYTVTIDGVKIDSGSWIDGQLISFNIDGLAIGEYIYVITAQDAFENTITDTVVVKVADTITPTISNPVDITYLLGTTGNTISWTANDADPGTYDMYRNGAQTAFGRPWTSTSPITMNVDGFSVGVYNFTIVVSDTQGNSVSDTVFVTVADVQSSSTTQTTSTDITNTDITSSDDTTSDNTNTDDTTSDNSNSDDTSTPTLPVPFSNIFIITVSLLGLVVITRRMK